jgi:hypothetical protein
MPRCELNDAAAMTQSLSDRRFGIALGAGFSSRICLSSACDFGLDRIDDEQAGRDPGADVVGCSRLMREYFCLTAATPDGARHDGRRHRARPR